MKLTQLDQSAFAIPTIDSTPETLETVPTPEHQGPPPGVQICYPFGPNGDNANAATKTNTTATSGSNAVDARTPREDNEAVKAFKATVNPFTLTPGEAKAQRQLVREFCTNEGFRQACMFEAGMNDDVNNMTDEAARDAILHDRASKVRIAYIEPTEGGGGTIYMELPDDLSPAPFATRAGAGIYKNDDGILAVAASIETTPEIQEKADKQAIANGIKFGCIWEGDGYILKNISAMQLAEPENLMKQQLTVWNLQVRDVVGDAEMISALVSLGGGEAGINIMVVANEGYAPAGGMDKDQFNDIKRELAERAV